MEQKITADDILEAYRIGKFPMADSRTDDMLTWRDPRKRGIIPIDGFHNSKRMMRMIRQHKFTVKTDHAFREVMDACADREETWISNRLTDLYCELFDRGYAHSVEIYDLEDQLVAGQYGIALGGAFFGESIFNHAKYMDKVSFYYSHKILQDNGYLLWDHQFYTPHLAQFGCIQISRRKYKNQLTEALKAECEFKLQIEDT